MTPGDRVLIVTNHFLGQDQRATVVEHSRRLRGSVKVRLDNVRRRRVRIYHPSSLRPLNAVELLGELVR